MRRKYSSLCHCLVEVEAVVLNRILKRTLVLSAFRVPNLLKTKIDRDRTREFIAVGIVIQPVYLSR